jgi:hypothetical protein
VQTIIGNAPMTMCSNPFLHAMQREINPIAVCTNRRRAAEIELPHLFHCCQRATAIKLQTSWPVSLMMDGVSRKNNNRFEAFYGLVFLKFK